MPSRITVAVPTFANHGEQDGVEFSTEFVASPTHTQEDFVTRAAGGIIDKSKWPRGPWDDEPNRLEFIWRGLPCSVVRHPNFGSLMGYVGVPKGHPWTTQRTDDAFVHGGLTYWNGPTDRIRWSKPLAGCVWFGFDCNHAGDLAPGMPITRGVYRDLEYVATETRLLADQARRDGPTDMQLLFPDAKFAVHDCALCKKTFYADMNSKAAIVGTVTLKANTLNASYCESCAPKVADVLFQLGFLPNVT